MSMFLSDEEKEAMTGMERNVDQMRWLDDHQLPYFVSAKGRAVVLRSVAPEPGTPGYEPYVQPPTELYRHYGADGSLLYVGISLSTLARTQQHRWGSEWFSQVTRIEIERYALRREAEEAEKAAIREERPKFNILHAEDTEPTDEIA